MALRGVGKDQLQLLQREIDLLKLLKNPYIVEYRESFNTRDMLYIVMEFVENGTCRPPLAYCHLLLATCYCRERRVRAESCYTYVCRAEQDAGARYLTLTTGPIPNAGSLSNILRKFGKLPEALVAMYTLQVLEGLNFLHDQGVIHRDIKGANILISTGGKVSAGAGAEARRMRGKSSVAGRSVTENGV